jgi:EpsI family protein
MRLVTLSVVLAGLMAASSVAGIAARPTKKAQEVGPKFVLADSVPKQFGSWRELPLDSVMVVNPQAQELIDKLYSQTLNRTYINADGYRIMLSLAYGDDQRGGLALHKPEICYPAQGFKVNSTEEAVIATGYGDIPARRLSTTLGPRNEPVTYWFNVGDTAIKSKIQQRIIELKLGLTGQIPDGLLFRVSSIDKDSARAFKAHESFVTDLLSAVGPVERARLGGVGKPG